MLIAGDVSHPEVQAIYGHCKGDYAVVADAAELVEFMENHPNLPKKRVILVAQTTLNVKEWANIVKA